MGPSLVKPLDCVASMVRQIQVGVRCSTQGPFTYYLNTRWGEGVSAKYPPLKIYNQGGSKAMNHDFHLYYLHSWIKLLDLLLLVTHVYVVCCVKSGTSMTNTKGMLYGCRWSHYICVGRRFKHHSHQYIQKQSRKIRELYRGEL